MASFPPLAAGSAAALLDLLWRFSICRAKGRAELQSWWCPAGTTKAALSFLFSLYLFIAPLVLPVLQKRLKVSVPTAVLAGAPGSPVQLAVLDRPVEQAVDVTEARRGNCPWHRRTLKAWVAEDYAETMGSTQNSLQVAYMVFSSACTWEYWAAVNQQDNHHRDHSGEGTEDEVLVLRRIEGHEPVDELQRYAAAAALCSAYVLMSTATHICARNVRGAHGR